MSIVYHYTSQQAAYSIAETESFRFTNIHFLNDGSEWRWFFNRARALHEESPISWVAEELNRRNLQREHLRALGNEDAENECADSVSIFVACFSAAKDDASQWDRYANNGRGICLGFDEERLSSWIKQTKEFSDPPSFVSGRVNYDIDQTDSLIRGCDHYPVIGGVLHKSYSYRSEDEFRLAHCGVGYQRYNFMPKEDVLQCFITSRIPDFWSVLKEVWVGSSARPETYYAWETLLSIKFNGDYFSRIALKRSQSMLRG